MEAMRQSWTDERLDDFSGQVWRRFDEIDRRFEGVDRRFDEVDRRLDDIDRRLDRLEDRMDDLGRTIHRTMLQLGGGMIATLAIGLIGVIVTNG